MSDILLEISATIEQRKQNPKEGSYTNYLLDKGLDKILKKVGEEATETVIAAKNDSTEDFVGEVADLLYHLSVLLGVKGMDWQPVFAELARRELKEGNLKEKQHPEMVSDY